MLRSRILWKLYAGYVALILLSTIVVGVLVSNQVEEETLIEIERSLDVRAALLSDVASESFSLSSHLQVQERFRTLGDKTNTRYTIIKSDGTVIADSEENPGTMDKHANRPEVLAARSHGFGMATRFSNTIDTKMMYFALSVHKEGLLLGYVRTSLPLSVIDSRLSRIRNIVLFGMGVSIFVALLLGFFVARGFAKPLTAMTTIAESMSDGNYDQRVSINRKDEIGSLAGALNKMARSSRERMETIALDNNKLLAILAGMVEGVVAVDRSETIIHLNEAAGRILDILPQEDIDRRIWEATQSQELCQVISEALNEETEIRKKLQIITGSTNQIVEVHASPFRDAAGGLVGVVAVIYDVSELERLENIRRDFVANVSHELKTPITAIRGLVETVINDKKMSPENHRNFLLKTMDQTIRLSTIVTDLLALSRLESVGIDLTREPIDLREVVNSSMRALLPVSEDKGIQIESHIPDEPIQVLGDREALYQSFNNLLDNAIKYNSINGTVWVRLQKEDGNAVIEVQDTGIGVEPLERHRIFERFYRVDKARSRQLGGTGLGLSIVKHTTLSHGGQLSVESTPGTGSTFQISIPLLKSS
ncbi:MAG: HAMP domain-containing protein [Nitrospina sp.]|jgi:two-component system, OmpR family, phosphate regulon sensor histidine kinase PhoR|nr:HAMP domain-containing protein [Nitrospina sp.]MBT3508626.1 HAMP domain-containing protein [Nitrospina sp.]MBT3875650.1 HAMP domain-containing protein [Nitrospina sp.]MBT4048513.1 HAMP domain-containing protein [Nitrospina sp.]MBT4558923.1 HAMP domain-containing protein [Nitrospina sp.]